jgi:hypothetical protein
MPSAITAPPTRRTCKSFRVRPGNLGGLVSYEYRLNDEPASTIAAAADGTPPPLVGQEVTLIFHPGRPGVTEYLWSTDFGATEQVAPAGPDGQWR